MIDQVTSIYMKGRWVLLLTGLVVCGILALTCHGSAPAPLPTPIAQRVEQHAVQTSVDTAEVHGLERSGESAVVKKDTAVSHARLAADSGDYHAAYVAEDTALVAVEREAALLDLALTRSEARANQADSVIAAVLPLAEAREPPCRILGFIPCPTRRAVAAVAATLTAAAFILTPRLVKP